MQVIALGAGQSVFEVHGMVHSILVIIANPSHMPEAQSDAEVQVVQSSERAPPSPPLDEPLLDPLELPELLPLLDPLDEPEELPELLPLPLELPLLEPLELPELEPLSASDPELDPLLLLLAGPPEDELEHAGIMPTATIEEAAMARTR